MNTRAQRRADRGAGLDLRDASDEALLNMRLRELPVRLANTLVARRVARLHRELAMRGIVALPHVWLSEEFFTPEGVLGFAVPFYLAHPRLMRLERSQMLECEGAGEAECRRILRHEAGHALDEAYLLGTRPRYRHLFGDPETPYPDSYVPRIDSRDHVINLAAWYAQAHPVEDFAETFAVWLNPFTDWSAAYRGWPALEKLAYASLRRTLRDHYAAKRAHFAWPWPANYDRDLRRIFSDDPKDEGAPPATRYLRRMRQSLRKRIADGTGVHAYAVDQLLRQMIARAQSLGLKVVEAPDATMQKLLVMLTMQTAGLVHAGFPKVAL
jgi:hypothetical protein